MRYCLRCGNVIDEFDSDRDCVNCFVCGAVWEEDNMTALKYAELSEPEKDEYDEKLLNLIQNSPEFDNALYQRWCSMESGEFWSGFRLQKYLPFCKEEHKDFYLTSRKNNEPFKPFFPIDKERAMKNYQAKLDRRKSYNEKRKQKLQANLPQCPYCGSTNISKISRFAKMVDIEVRGAWAIDDISKTYKCKNCKKKF